MAIGKKVRFEIFKRDKFLCQYCGRKPPEITLEVDHVLAVARGGSDEVDNLLTSCFDCNRGKSDHPLERSEIPVQITVDERRERLEQIKALEAAILSERTQYDNWAHEIMVYWASLGGGLYEDDGLKKFRFSKEMDASVRRFIRKIVKSEIMEAVDIAYAKIPYSKGKDYHNQERLLFFFGVCWRKIKNDYPY